MRDILSKVDITPGDLGPAVVALYREAANHSLKTLWQRSLLVSGVPRDTIATRQGAPVAEFLTRQEAGQPALTPVATETAATLMATMRQTAKQHLAETRTLNADLKQQRLADAAAHRKRMPGFWSQAHALISDAHARQVKELEERLTAEYGAKETARQTERTALLTRHRQELHAIRRQRLEVQAPASAPVEKDMLTRQELINTRVLTALTAQKMRPFGGQTVSALYFAALTQRLAPNDQLLDGFAADKAFTPGSEAAKVRADARVLSFGLTVEHAVQETLRLQDTAQRAPDYARNKAQQVQAVLQNGFASEAGKLFQPGLQYIRDAIGEKIDTLAALPTPPSGQVIPFAPQNLRA